VSFYPFIVLFYFLLLFIMHMFVVSILPAYKWLPPFAADVQIKLHVLYCTGIVNAMRVSVRELQNVKGKGKVFPYSLPSVGPGADPGVQAVSPQVT